MWLLLTMTLMAGEQWGAQRQAMVDLIAARGVQDARVLDAMREFPRHELVPKVYRAYAYDDRALPIGYEQTISQPYIVAFMSEAVAIKKGDKVLEIGTGSGYQAAILAKMGAKVFSIEIVSELGQRAKKDLQRLGVKNVEVRIGDGYKGWPKEAPFAAIVVTAAPTKVPKPLLDQLAPEGRLIIPVGEKGQQWLQIYRRHKDGFHMEKVFPVAFVPMTGKADKL